MLPPDEGLDALRPAGPGGDLHLVVDAQLTRGDGVAEIGQQLQLLGPGRRQAVLGHLDRAVAVHRLREGGLTGLQQGGQVPGDLTGERDPDVTLQLQVDPGEAVRSPDQAEHVLRRPLRAPGEGARSPARLGPGGPGARERRRRQDRREAVAGDPGPQHRRAGPARGQRDAYPGDQLLGGRVPEVLHHLTEPADLQQEHGDRFPRAGGRGQDRVPWRTSPA